MPGFPRAARLNVAVVLRQLCEATCTVLIEDGACPGGQVGAAYVRWADGHRSVLTCRPWGSLASVRQAKRLLELRRARGVPAPHYELVAELPCALAIVQELLPGFPPVTVDRRTVESMVREYPDQWFWVHRRWERRKRVHKR